MGGAATPAHGHRLPVSCSGRGSDLSPSFTSFSFTAVFIQSNFHLVINKSTVQKKSCLQLLFLCHFCIDQFSGFHYIDCHFTLSLKYAEWGAAKSLHCEAAELLPVFSASIRRGSSMFQAMCSMRLTFSEATVLWYRLFQTW